jgi:hypothetical protein
LLSASEINDYETRAANLGSLLRKREAFNESCFGSKRLGKVSVGRKQIERVATEDEGKNRAGMRRNTAERFSERGNLEREVASPW